jgi:FAD/FMN-containing dehydrogenase
MQTVMASFEDKKRALSAQLRQSAGEVRLKKGLTHLFRDRASPQSTRLDVRAFDQVIGVDTTAGTVDVEGMTSYEALAAATFAHGVLPAVVPQLKGITIGGACAGLGIESSSFRYGLAHETVEEMEILLADGEVVLASPTNEHSDLFFGFPNSFGTLGYALRIRARTIPAKPYVELTHIRFDDAEKFFAAVSDWCGRAEADFVDGVVFRRGEYFLTVGRFVDEAPYVSDYTWLNIYYRSIRERERDYLTALDYIWRWDTDWFWCSHELGMQNPLVRRLVGRKRLNSIFYKQLIDWKPGYRARQVLRAFSSAYRENVIQDVDVTVDKGPEFLDFMLDKVGLLPMWICPFRSWNPTHRYPLFPTRPDALYVNFGFWDQKVTREAHEPGHFNRLVEGKLTELGGIKSLYSDSFYEEETFWRIYSGDAYRKLKARYDPKGRLSDIYRKCVLRQ